VDDEPGEFALTPWQQLGFDSLSMTDFVRSCNSAFQLGREWALADTSMFDHPSPAKLAAVLLDSVKGSARDREAQQAAAAAVAGAPSAEAAGDKAASAARGAGAEPLAAIVGMALRFPGPHSNCTPAGFWAFLQSGQDALSEFPAERFPVGDAAAMKGIYAPRGGFLHPELFRDAKEARHLLGDRRFPISAAELASVDPQQMLALQVAAEALDDAAAGGWRCVDTLPAGAGHWPLAKSGLVRPLRRVHARRAAGRALLVQRLERGVSSGRR
jgi:hypothetical protein